MKNLPKQMKTVWYVMEVISALTLAAILAALNWLLPLFFKWTMPKWLMSLLVILALLAVVFGFFLVHYRYAVYHYRVNEHSVEIQKGFFFRRLIAIPIDRIQNVDLDQGPLLQLFHLQKVVLVTGGSHHEVEALLTEEAQAFKDRVMLLAKEARREA
ncbi:PH domain-containing protein [Fructobacillus parabroussonetiae]|uniref:PH domain-containing protein n=1 Tax=Fructobacillus parabroussonetiae TaxID=2713174 RepID=A0ABS5QVL9_9LACO|nr:PH domain-containing protein [Fructobacillus parabroussonetiae]MBS9337253.1 PH domain-containing protein [Fructobacillus parabroussonetiae]